MIGLKFFQQQQRVYEYVAFGMVLGRLLYSFHGGDFWKDFGEEFRCVQKFEGFAGVALG
jgi:hypothetical protein